MLFRCSALGEIMTDPQGKSNLQKFMDAEERYMKSQIAADKMIKKDGPGYAKLMQSIEKSQQLIKELAPIKDVVLFSATRKKRLRMMYIEYQENRFKSIKNKYIRKGHKCENDAITLYSLIKGEFYRKNEERLSDQWITGETDFFKGKSVREAEITIDTKACWDRYTYYAAMDADDINHDYFCQGQGYMKLTGAQQHTIAYCCVNTPLNLVEKEIYFEDFEWPGNQAPTWAKMQIVANMVYDRKTFEDYCRTLSLFPDDPESTAVFETFTEIPRENSMYEVTFDRDDEFIERMYEELAKCREYLNTSGKFKFDAPALTA